MNELVLWAQRWPQAEVERVALMNYQTDEENKARRYRFYEQFGLIFDSFDAEQKEGQCRLMPAQQLMPVETWKQNIIELPVMGYLADLLQEQIDTAWVLQQRTETVQLLRSDQQLLHAQPIRWMFSTLYYKYYQPIGLVMRWVVIVIGLASWRTLSVTGDAIDLSCHGRDQLPYLP